MLPCTETSPCFISLLITRSCTAIRLGRRRSVPNDEHRRSDSETACMSRACSCASSGCFRLPSSSVIAVRSCSRVNEDHQISRCHHQRTTSSGKELSESRSERLLRRCFRWPGPAHRKERTELLSENRNKEALLSRLPSSLRAAAREVRTLPMQLGCASSPSVAQQECFGAIAPQCRYKSRTRTAPGLLPGCTVPPALPEHPLERRSVAMHNCKP